MARRRARIPAKPSGNRASTPEALLLSIADVAKRVGRSSKTISRLIGSGHLRAFRLAGKGAWMIRWSDVEGLLIPSQPQYWSEGIDEHITKNG